MSRILIVKPSSLGDIIHGLLVAASIREQRPGVHISWIARELFAPLVEACTAVDRVYVFHRHDGVMAFLRTMREVRRERFDQVLDFQGLLRSGLMTWLARGTQKFGRRDDREGARLFYHRRTELPPGGSRAHAVDILLRFCPLLGLAPSLHLPLTFRPPAGFNPALAELQAFGPALVLFPGSRRRQKRWNGFAELTTALLRTEPQLRIVWAGDQPVPGPEAWRGGRFLNLTGRTTLDALPEVVHQATLVVGNDSGPMHLAAAMARPVVAIFGPTDPDRFGPYPPRSPRNRVVRAPLADLRQLPARDVVAFLRGLPEWPAVRAGQRPRLPAPAQP